MQPKAEKRKIARIYKIISIRIETAVKHYRFTKFQ